MLKPMLTIGAVLLLTTAAHAADFTGKFKAANDAMVIELKSAGADQYTGTLSAADQSCALTATAKDQKISGKFVAGGNTYSMEGTLEGDQLTVTTGGATYVLTRPATAGANPFGAGSATAKAANAGDPAKPAAAAAVNAAEVIPAEGKELAVTASGRTLFFVYPDAKDAAAGIRAVVAPINKRLGGELKLGSAFADTKNAACGTGSFTMTVGAVTYTGTILCGPAKTGEAVSVVYLKKGAPAAEVMPLMAALPSNVTTETFTFPDGSGTLELPQGWTVQSQTLADPLLITGPNHQVVSMGGSLPVQTPDSPLMKLKAQNDAFAKAHGFAPQPPMKGILIAPFDKPSVAIKELLPQIAEISKENGKPWNTNDSMTEIHDMPAHLPNGKAESIDSLGTLHDGDKEFKMRAVTLLESTPIAQGSWMLFINATMSSEQERFPGDSIVMLAIMRSVKPNQKVLSEIFEQRLEANQQLNEQQRRDARDRYEAGVKAHDEQIAGYDRYNKNWRDQEVAKDKSAKDYIEYIRGYRTVEDTTTGERKDVDLSNVHDTMDALNRQDPGRYKEIPLRDQ